eukprot:CAMPEP_0116008018 /NCGR_PEP_ID=MMETSP0321-20121206/2621_1 /TAXON_ID=163516 /ORGANISM="Leptocylindrus danicus var. danicus, Strain B650" /LENGTH=478 /DNA_ID=CAMNT_0003476777 /DNA_START=120 /DNA_END=1556 /DNA_ORIENTATION=-
MTINNAQCPTLLAPLHDLSTKRLTIIGHRGSSFNIPEHTIAGYRLAMELGADYIEPDLVPTKDGHLVAVHSVDLNITTDVALKFPDRYRLDVEHEGYSNMSGYFVNDFTLEEVKQLRVKQRVEDTEARSRVFDWLFDVPTLGEIMDLMASWDNDVLKSIGRTERPGLYVELKMPGWLQADSNTSVEELLVSELKNHEHGYKLFFNSSDICGAYGNEENNRMRMLQSSDESAEEYQRRRRLPPLVMQCFEHETLERLQLAFAADEDVFEGVVPPNVLLVSKKHFFSDPQFFFHVSSYKFLDGLGPDKDCLFQGGDGRGFIQKAHEYKLAVHPWTSRLETEFVDDRFATIEEELEYLYCDIGIDGMFIENVDVGTRIASAGCPKAAEVQHEVTSACTSDVETPVLALLIATAGGCVLGATFLLAAQKYFGHHRNHMTLKTSENGDEDAAHRSNNFEELPKNTFTIDDLDDEEGATQGTFT